MIIKKGKSQVTFVFNPTEPCRTVAIMGDFNNWQSEQGHMARQKDGSFRKRVSLSPGQYRYKFLVDGRWVVDPEAEQRVPNPFGTEDALLTVS